MRRVDDRLSSETYSWQPTQYTKVRTPAPLVAGHPNIRVELHGLEDGTIPATFQVIFLVRFPSPLAERTRQETNASGVDRVETESEPAKAFAEGKWADESEGCVVVEDVRCELKRWACRMTGQGCPPWRMMICNNTQSNSMLSLNEDQTHRRRSCS